MLDRVLEPEVMDTADEAATYDAMDHSVVNQRFVSDLLGTGLHDGEVLDLGTGTARIPIELCQRAAAIRVFAADAARHMLEVARRNLESAGLADRILLVEIDAKRLPFDNGRFQAVISNSIVHHIPEPESVFREAVRVVRPRGLLFFRDLARPTSEDQLRALVSLYAGHESPHAQHLFADSLRAALTVSEVATIVASLGLDPARVQMTSDRHWTWNAWLAQDLTDSTPSGAPS